MAAAGGLVRRPDQLPRQPANELVYTGGTMIAQRPGEHGRVNRVLPADGLVNAAFDLAREIAAAAPLAVQASKRAMNRTTDRRSENEVLAWEISRREAQAIRRTRDAQEGPLAFAEKRAPRWEA